MFKSAFLPTLLWCLTGYFFLGRGETTGAILASVASITAAFSHRTIRLL